MRTLTFYITVIISLLSLTIHSASAVDRCVVKIQEEQELTNPFLTMHNNTQFQVIDFARADQGSLERAYDTEIYAKVTFDLGNNESYGGEQLHAFLQITVGDDVVTMKDGEFTAMPIHPDQEYSWHLSRLVVVAKSGFKVIDTIEYKVEFLCDQ